jgi:predicted transposase/invertase (TIGR01784 family)
MTLADEFRKELAKRRILVFKSRAEGQAGVRDEDWKSGWEEGLEDGREEGFEAGFEEGRLDAINEVAEKLLELSVPIDKIAQATDLTPGEIKSLAEED